MTTHVDGLVAGQWRLDVAPGSATMVLEPFVPMRDALLAEAATEAKALAALKAPGATRTDVVLGIARDPAIPRDPG